MRLMPMKRARNITVHIRMNEMEHHTLRENAKQLNTTPSALVRALVTLPVELQEEALEHDNARSVVVFDRAAIANLMKQIRMWGYHYDQAVHALNIIASRRFMRPEDAAHYMKKATSLLEEIEEARSALEGEASRLAIRALAHLPLGRER